MSNNSAWLDLLRNAVSGASLRKVGERIGYSPAVVSTVLAGTYKGNLQAVQKAVEGALMGAVVDCPVIGELELQRCVEHQRATFRSTNPTAVQLHRTCPTCQHNLSTGKAGKDVT